jgi:hypothetical protein
LDGLTFDSFTGHLWATVRDSQQLLEIDPANLANFTLHATGDPAIHLDGISTDNAGNLFYTSNSTGLIYEYNILSASIVYRSPIIVGLDDIAPLAGLGGGVPEPASLSLLAIGIGGFMIRRRR